MIEEQETRIARLTADAEDIRQRIGTTKEEPTHRHASQLEASKTALRNARWEGVRRWYINGQGQTMVIILNSAESGSSQIDHSFAIASREVTVTEFRRFRDQHRVDVDAAPSDDCPVNSVQWFDAAAYCNWLSEQEGIPKDEWVYQPNDEGQYADGMMIKENFLELTGYRLATDAEWEYACRGGSSGSYGYGEPLPLLERYAQYVANSFVRSHSVGSLLPNAAGLFDMHGNLWEWVQTPNSGSMSPVRNESSTWLRGGSFLYPASKVRSAQRSPSYPSCQFHDFGFRTARTHHSSP